MKHFKIQELVPSSMIATHTEAVLWRLFVPELIEGLDELREDFGAPIRINHNGLEYCGYRPADTTIGAPNSAHKHGRAVDVHCDDIYKLLYYICKYNDSYGIVRLENPAVTIPKGYLHIEFGEECQDLDIFNP